MYFGHSFNRILVIRLPGSRCMVAPHPSCDLELVVRFVKGDDVESL
jgi:hypothetical protein